MIKRLHQHGNTHTQCIAPKTPRGDSGVAQLCMAADCHSPLLDAATVRDLLEPFVPLKGCLTYQCPSGTSIQLLYLVVTGSRLHGTNTEVQLPDQEAVCAPNYVSDYDLKGVFVLSEGDSKQTCVQLSGRVSDNIDVSYTLYEESTFKARCAEGDFMSLEILHSAIVVHATPTWNPPDRDLCTPDRLLSSLTHSVKGFYKSLLKHSDKVDAYPEFMQVVDSLETAAAAGAIDRTFLLHQVHPQAAYLAAHRPNERCSMDQRTYCAKFLSHLPEGAAAKYFAPDDAALGMLFQRYRKGNKEKFRKSHTKGYNPKSAANVLRLLLQLHTLIHTGKLMTQVVDCLPVHDLQPLEAVLKVKRGYFSKTEVMDMIARVYVAVLGDEFKPGSSNDEISATASSCVMMPHNT